MSKTMTYRMPEIEQLWRDDQDFIDDAEYFINRQKEYNMCIHDITRILGADALDFVSKPSYIPAV